MWSATWALSRENPYDPQYAGFIEGMKEVALHLKQQNQYLLFESGQETPVTMLRAFEDIGTGNLGVNLDTANLILYGKANPVDACVCWESMCAASMQKTAVSHRWPGPGEGSPPGAGQSGFSPVPS